MARSHKLRRTNDPVKRTCTIRSITFGGQIVLRSRLPDGVIYELAEAR